jgi:hypothetical protein
VTEPEASAALDTAIHNWLAASGCLADGEQVSAWALVVEAASPERPGQSVVTAASDYASASAQLGLLEYGATVVRSKIARDNE